ncbi:MAG: ECF transporter S component [Coriobacteriales bacterium]|jgi:energy-coupling factor transport system substrate-specific component|nr:ECF transporter S component [Coriobacteriales bacterium]
MPGPEKRRLSNRTKVAAVLVILCIPLVIAINILFFEDRSYYITSFVIIALSMVPFALVFEGRKPQARELVVIAVLVALTVAGRTAFFMVPQFKPVVAMVIIAGASLGAESGFVVGALSAFVSNFIFGQGPWTPWQMFAFGIIGFIAGLLFYQLAASIGAPSRDGSMRPENASYLKWYDINRLGSNVRARRRVERLRILVLCVFSGTATFVLYGFLLDTAAVLMFTSGEFSWTGLVATYVSGIPMNAVHASATVCFLLLLAKPMIEKLERVKKKYGLLGAQA